MTNRYLSEKKIRRKVAEARGEKEPRKISGLTKTIAAIGACWAIAGAIGSCNYNSQLEANTPKREIQYRIKEGDRIYNIASRLKKEYNLDTTTPELSYRLKKMNLEADLGNLQPGQKIYLPEF